MRKGDLTLQVYRRTRGFAKDEPYGIASQKRRGRVFHLLLAKDLEILTSEQFSDLERGVLEFQRILASLGQQLQGPILARARS